MKCKLNKGLILLILLLQNWSLSADVYYCKGIGIGDGLSQSSVTSVTYDGNGALWVGTRFGLNEYRNGNLRSFLGNGDAGLVGNYVNLLFCDTNGTLWTSTDKGIFRYDRSQDSFILLDSKPVYCAAQIAGTVYFGGHNGVSSFCYDTDGFSPGLSDIYTDIVSIHDYRDALVIVDKKEPIKFIKDGKESSIIIPETEGNLIMASVLVGNLLYLSVMNVGLLVYDISGRKATRVYRHGSSGLPDELILSLLPIGHTLWIGTDGAGIRLFDMDTGTFIPADVFTDSVNGRIPMSVTTLYKDPSDNVWIGSVRNGLLGLKSTSIKFLLHDLDSSSSMEGNVIIWLFDSDDGYVYAGTDGNGVIRYEPSSGRIHNYPGQALMKVTCIADFDASHLILSIYNKGLFLMDRKSGTMKPFLIVDKATNDAECLNSNAPKLYKVDHEHILLFAVNTYLYDLRTGTFSLFTDTTDGQTAKELVYIGPAGAGAVFAYTSRGLFLADLERHRLSPLYEVGSMTGNINTAVAHNGRIIFGTNYGLFVFNTLSQDVEQLRSGLFSRVSRLENSATGDLWIAADNTLFLYKDGVFQMVGENRGVPANELLASVSSSAGNVYFGGTAGMLEIGRDYSFELHENKNIVLHDISVMGKRVSIPKRKLKLGHNYSSLTLTVNLSGADPFEKVLFRYNVSGPNGFSSETFEDKLALPALNSGSYSVDAQYLRSDGGWSTPETVLIFRVNQPWYRSILMIVIYFFLFAGALAFLIKYISKRTMARMEAELRARDIQFTAKVDSYINEHLSDSSLNVSELASQMAMSRASLYNKINSSFGKGVAELIEERRMRKAEELLTTTSLPVLDISEKVGYSTSRYFSTRFKLLHDGITPLAYRNRFRG